MHPRKFKDNDYLKFNTSEILKKAKDFKKKKLKGISINLPFVSFEINTTDEEKKIAREVLIRLKDKRVLTSFECCDNCIRRSLDSLFEIRKLLVDKQVELPTENTSLFLIFEFMLQGLRDFMTHTENFDYRDKGDQKKYFEALRILRRHLFRCITEIEKYHGNSQIISPKFDFDKEWGKQFYLTEE